MAGFSQLRVRRSVRVFAVTVAVFAASIEAGWTPTRPWAPAVTVVGALADFGPTAPFARAMGDQLEEIGWYVAGGAYWVRGAYGAR